eukprot:3551591-Rhodomonas_salina.1
MVTVSRCNLNHWPRAGHWQAQLEVRPPHLQTGSPGRHGTRNLNSEGEGASAADSEAASEAEAATGSQARADPAARGRCQWPRRASASGRCLGCHPRRWHRPVHWQPVG